MYNNEMNLKIIDIDLKALTAFTIHVGEYGRPAKCFAEVRSLGVTCRGESQAEVLCRVTARVLRIMSRRMAQGMVVPDMLEDLFGTVPRTIDGLGQCNFVFSCKPMATDVGSLKCQTFRSPCAMARRGKKHCAG